MEKILIHGTGTSGKLLYHSMLEDDIKNVIAFVCDNKYYNNQTFCGLNVFKVSTMENYFPPDEFKVISTGVFNSVRERYNSYLNIKSKGYSFTNYISKKAIVANI